METTDQGMSEEQAMDALDVSEDIETEEVETEEVEAVEVDEDDGEDGDPETDLDDAEEDAEEADEDADDEAPDTYIVKVDGQDVEVTLDDLKRSYSGQEYIRKGMEENAQVHKELERHFEDLQAQRQHFAQLVKSVQEKGVISEPTPPDPEMSFSDPIGYMQERAEYDKKLAAYQQQQQAIQAETAQQQQAQQQRHREFLEAQKARVLEAIPDFGDPQKATRIMNDMVSLGAEYGISAEELARVSDARVVIALHDLLQYRTVKNSQRKVAEKVAKARPVVKPGNANKSAGRAKKRQDLMSKLRETGSDEYALRLLEE